METPHPSVGQEPFLLLSSHSFPVAALWLSHGCLVHSQAAGLGQF